MELLKNPETRFKGLTMLVKLVEVETLVSKAKKIIVEQLGATFVDAEYEADGLLARMALSGDVDLVMTEDTDLIVYGCSKKLYKYKMDVLKKIYITHNTKLTLQSVYRILKKLHTKLCVQKK